MPTAEGEAVGGAQGCHQQLVVSVSLREQFLVLHTPRSALRVHGAVPLAAAAVEAVRRGAEAEVRRAVPVAAVVARAVAGAGIVAHLVLLEASAASHCLTA